MIYTQSFPIQFTPIANQKAIVIHGKARFTVLTSKLLRLEYSPEGRFEDRPSQAFWHRRQPLPEFEVRHQGEELQIETESLLLRYLPSEGGFTAEGLTIVLKTAQTTWHYGEQDSANLQGTARTLDNIDGALALENGLLSRRGWAVYDDSRRLVFDEHGWLQPRPGVQGTQDLYFFAYGHDYAQALKDFFKVAGTVPMIPRWILGNWWSRYWAYTADELLRLVDEFKAHDIPLSVCIVDMDWHITDTGNAASGWTGYTWNQALFPDPPGFIAALHERGLRTALNLHPAEGVYPHEAQYAQMAERLGSDPASQQPLPFDIANPDFTRAYFEILHHPYEAQGVDFWWLDWQQGKQSKLAGLDPLWWLNHLHFYDLGRRSEKRPFIFSRWGGLGNHRYPIGFSGDTVVSWESLAFQPYFTATAANVGYGWWSHDIGGHMQGTEDAELYTRWVQFGALSPILRLHCTKNAFHERRPWGYDAETEQVTRQAMQLRHALIPYLYSMAWRYHTQGEAPIRPMYHDSPEQEAAYHCPDQYHFGSELLAAPFSTPADLESRLSRQVVWLPEGEWFDFFSGVRYPGGGWQALYGGLRDIPLFARAGAIIPLAPRTVWGGVEIPDELEIHLFPGAQGRFELYEDDGLQAYSLMPITQRWASETWEIEIGPVQGETGHLPPTRSCTLLLRAAHPQAQIALLVNGIEQPCSPLYEATSRTLRLSPLSLKPGDRLGVRLTGQPLTDGGDHRLAQCQKLLSAMRMKTWDKTELEGQLAGILANPERLEAFELAMTPAQLRAWQETLYQAGAHHSPLRGRPGEQVVLWNNQENPQTGYRLLAYNLAGQTRQRSGILPRFAVLSEVEGALDFQEGETGVRRFNSAADWFQALPPTWQAEGLEGVQAVVQLTVVQGEAETAWMVHASGGRLQPLPGKHPAPNATLHASEASWLALVNGEVPPMELFMQGKLQAEGEPDLLLKIGAALEVLPRDRYLRQGWRLELRYGGGGWVKISPSGSRD